MSDLAASRSPDRKASVAAATPSLTSAKSWTTFWSISSSSRRNSTRASSGMARSSLRRLAEPAGDVVLGAAVVGLGEDLGGRPALDETAGLTRSADVEESGGVAHA